ncbi:MAG TPA: nucleotidyltransferase family protein [Longimicrobium sp.]|jgi:NDP-sugar pyrophosphorylase family protein|uniref:nucleotidyltransferase family protein n=1 Tax=Longimicrobium sp. TaxID=2029185 RepID=UPI002ED92D25
MPPAPHTDAAPPPVVILGGGLGTRLRSVVADRPKVLAPVLGRPFLDHLLRFLAAQGVREAVVSTGYRGEQIDAFVGAQDYGALRVRCVREREPLGTGGALRWVLDREGWTGAFAAMNGDTFLGLELASLAAFHRARPDALASVALARVPATDRYGRVESDPATGRVRAFVEKAPGQGPGWINAGVYLLEPAALAAVRPGQAASLERDVLAALAGGALYGHRLPSAPFLDIGTPEDYARAAQVLPRADAPHPHPPDPVTP